MKYVTRYLRNDRDIVMAAVISDGNALQYVSDDFRSDRDIMLAAVASAESFV